MRAGCREARSLMVSAAYLSEVRNRRARDQSHLRLLESYMCLQIEAQEK